MKAGSRALTLQMINSLAADAQKTAATISDRRSTPLLLQQAGMIKGFSALVHVARHATH